jgi:putative oxidoreductase
MRFYFAVFTFLRIALGLVFIVAGFIKAQDFQAFADSIASFDVLPNALINLIALSLPPFEILIGAMLVLGVQARGAAFSAMVLLAIFIVMLCQGLARDLKLDCGCFGSETPSTWKTGNGFARDVLLLVLASWVYLRLSRPKGLQVPA